MEKESKRRIIIYVIVWLLFTSAGFFGLYSYLNGHGKKGAAREELVPLVDKFNNEIKVAELKNHSIDLTAEVKISGTIEINYTTNDNVKHTYEFKYQEDKSNNRYITCNYKYDDAHATEIMQAMIDAVYHMNGGVDSVFDSYPYETFTRTTIEHGIQVIGGNIVTININLKTNIVNNIKDVDLNIKNEPYIIVEDLANMLQELDANGSYTIKKNTITIYILDLGYSYNIYAENTSTEVNDDLYNSLMNVIKMLYESTYNIILDNKDKLNKNTRNAEYEVILRAKLANRNEMFYPDSDLLEVVIYK